MGRRGAGLRVGVVGCGYWGAKHVRVLQSTAGVGRVVAIDPADERVAALQAAYPTLERAGSLVEALDDVDAVIIATPPRTHAGLALTAMRAGKGVLVEKPLATTTADAARLLAVAGEQAVVLMAGHTFEFNPAVWKLRELIAGGELGRLYYLDSARLNLGLYQTDVNVLWDLAPHDVSIFNHLLGSRPHSVQAWGARHAHHALEDVGYLRLEYPDLGVTANSHVSWLDPCKVRRVTVVGAEKMAVYNDLSTDDRVRIFDKGVIFDSALGLDGAGTTKLGDIPTSYRYGDIVSPRIDPREPLSIQDQHFVDCVRGNAQPRTDGRNGMAVVATLEAAEMSLREGRPVELAEVTPTPVLQERLAEPA